MTMMTFCSCFVK